jgi:hypothetical protein
LPLGNNGLVISIELNIHTNLKNGTHDTPIQIAFFLEEMFVQFCRYLWYPRRNKSSCGAKGISEGRRKMTGGGSWTLLPSVFIGTRLVAKGFTSHTLENKSFYLLSRFPVSCTNVSEKGLGSELFIGRLLLEGIFKHGDQVFI